MSVPDEITTYVTYLYPGAFFSEESTREVAGRDPERIAREAPGGVFAFSFHDIATTVTIVDGQETTLRSRPLRESGHYYIDAEKLTIADVEALAGDNRILLSNMRGNGWDAILRCRTGNYQPLQPGDTLISTREGAS